MAPQPSDVPTNARMYSDSEGATTRQPRAPKSRTARAPSTGNASANPGTLRDFPAPGDLSVDEILDDGGGQRFPLRAREVEATVLFADMSGFTRRSRDISPLATLIIANRFVAWLTGEGLRGVPCVIDKYIGDAMMVVFSGQFGSEDHLVDALLAARRFAEHDPLDLCPHMGLASGRVAVGYIGTHKRLQCSVFGLPVTLAARCASYPIRADHSASIVLPADLWRPQSMKLFGPTDYVHVTTGERSQGLPMWRRLRRRPGRLKHLEEVDVIPVIKHPSRNYLQTVQPNGSLVPTSIELEAERTLKELERSGRYKRPVDSDS